MTLLEVLALGNPQALAINDWGERGLKYLAVGPDSETHRATILFDPDSLRVECLEIFDPEGITWVWHEGNYDLPGTRVDRARALNTLAYLMRAQGYDPLQTLEEEDQDDPT